MTDWVFFSLHCCWGRQRLCCKSRSSKYTEGVAGSWIKMQIWRAYFKRCELRRSIPIFKYELQLTCAKIRMRRRLLLKAWPCVIRLCTERQSVDLDYSRTGQFANGKYRHCTACVSLCVRFWLLCMSNCDLAINNRPTLTFDIIMALTRHASNDGLC